MYKTILIGISKILLTKKLHPRGFKLFTENEGPQWIGRTAIILKLYFCSTAVLK